MSAEAQCSSSDASGVRTLTLNRPVKANSLGAGIVEEMLAHLAQAAADGTRLVVVRASGRNFCAGFDFTGFEEQSEGDLVLRFVRIEQLLQALRYAPFVTVACVQGAAFGAGADIVAACTYRIGSPSARLRFPGFRFGVALGTRHLARLVGVSRTRDILLRNRQLDAREALECGLLTRVVESEDFDAAVASVAEGLGELDQSTLGVLLHNTIEGTRDQELAELVRSVSVPGLHRRIARYRAASA